MRIRLGACFMGLAIAALTAGCGAGADATERQLSELRAELARMRAEGAVLSERLDAVERTRGPRGATAPRRGAGEPDRPALDVVRLDPSARAADAARPSPPLDDDALEPAADDDLAADAPRPVLRSGRSGEVVAEIGAGPGPQRNAAARPLQRPDAPRSTDKYPSPLSRRP